MAKKNSLTDLNLANSEYFLLGRTDQVRTLRLPFPSYRLLDDRYIRLTEAGELSRQHAAVNDDVLVYAEMDARTAWAGFCIGRAQRLEAEDPTRLVDAVRQAGLALAQGWFHFPHRVEYDALIDRWVGLVLRTMKHRPSWQSVLCELPVGQEPAIHSLRLAMTMGYVASVLAWTDRTQEQMIHAALGHDIGYSLDELPGGHAHVSAGLALLRTRRSLSETVYFGILHHHERGDGGGAPFGLKAAQIPWSAQILGLIDAWDEQEQITGQSSVILSKWHRFLERDGYHFGTRWQDSITQILESTLSQSIHATTP